MPEPADDAPGALTADHVVREYLAALRDHRPQRGRPPDPKRLERKIAELDERITAAESDDPLRLLDLVQRRLDLRAELEGLANRNRIQVLTEEFVAVAAAYSTAKGISYAAWRELGVPVSVLRRGGIATPT